MPGTEAVAAGTTVRRRRFSKEFKRQVVQETLVRGSSVAAIALRHRLNANLLFTWRRKYLRAAASGPAKGVKMLPMTIDAPSTILPAYPSAQPSTRKYVSRPLPRGVIEIEYAQTIIRVRGSVDPEALRVSLEVLCGR